MAILISCRPRQSAVAQGEHRSVPLYGRATDRGQLPFQATQMGLDPSILAYFLPI